IVPGTTTQSTTNGVPVGFKFSDDPNGFIFQIWAGHRNPRVPPHINVAPSGSVSSSSATINLPCPEGTSSDSCVPSATRSVDLVATYTDADGDALLFTWA